MTHHTEPLDPHGRPGRARSDETRPRQRTGWLWMALGFVASVWVLVRVLPKPDRAAYPCQRVAAPLAASFIAYVLSAAAASALFKRAGRYARSGRIWLLGLSLVAGAATAFLCFSMFPSTSQADFVPEAPNTPVGLARGLRPGGVAWIYNPDSVSWDGATGFWWEDTNTDQAEVDAMLERALLLYTAEASLPAAWDALFRRFNLTHGKGDAGYVAGEKVTVKINLNNGGAYGSRDNQTDTSPHLTLSLLRQLVNVVGVAQSDIAVYDAVRNITDVHYDKCAPEFPDVSYIDQTGTNGRTRRTWSPSLVWYGDPSTPGTGQALPECVVDAEYFINFAALKMHSIAGVTLIGKNLCGSIQGGPSNLHDAMRCSDRGPDAFNPLVDLMGHEHHGGKTLLYLIDGLYSSPSPGGNPRRWAILPFDNDWPSSLFLSQDGVAIDSVAVDLWHSEATLYDYSDNYLHEAALADDPPSGTLYDPEGDGTRLESLGAHEHWNSATDKQYTRNLGIGDGIKLIWERMTSASAPDLVTTMSLSHADPLRESESLTFDITIENRSPDAPDTNIRYTQRLLPGVSDFAMTTPPPVGTWNWDPGSGPNGELTVDLARLDPDDSVAFGYTVTVDATCGVDPYRLCHVGLTTSDWIRLNEPGPRGSDSGDGLPPEPVCTPDIASAGLGMVSVTKSITSPEPRDPGDPVAYEVAFVNDGPCTLSDGVFEDDIPASLVGFDPMGGMSIDPPGAANVSSGAPAGAWGRGLVRVENMELPAGGTLSIALTAELDAVPPCTSICNTGRYAFASSVGFADTDTVCQDVAPSWDVVVTKSFRALHVPVLEGDVVTYDIAVTNQSPVCEVIGGELTDDVPAGLFFALASAGVSIVSDPGGRALPGSEDPPSGAHNNGLVRVTDIDLAAGGAAFELSYQVRADTPMPPPGICNEAAVVVAGSSHASEPVCYEVEAITPPAAITRLRLRKQGDDVAAEAWDDDPNAASYSVYVVAADPVEKTLIGSANAAGMALRPDAIARVCHEASLPPPACVHTGAVSVSPESVFYQVVGVAANGEEGPN